MSQNRRERESRQERNRHGNGGEEVAKRVTPQKKPMLQAG